MRTYTNKILVNCEGTKATVLNLESYQVKQYLHEEITFNKDYLFTKYVRNLDGAGRCGKYKVYLVTYFCIFEGECFGSLRVPGIYPDLAFLKNWKCWFIRRLNEKCWYHQITRPINFNLYLGVPITITCCLSRDSEIWVDCMHA